MATGPGLPEWLLPSLSADALQSCSRPAALTTATEHCQVAEKTWTHKITQIHIVSFHTTLLTYKDALKTNGLYVLNCQ